MLVEGLQKAIIFLTGPRHSSPNHKPTEAPPTTPADPLTKEALVMYKFLTSNGATEPRIITHGGEDPD